MIIKVLTENTAINSSFYTEHGLSLYIETKNHKILFDLGQTDVYLKNAEILGVKLCDIDIVVISHGHYDHTGGLKSFLKINDKAKIYINENAKGDFFNKFDKYIGVEKSVLKNSRLIFTENQLEIDDELVLFTGNNFKRKYISYGRNLTTINNGVKQEDNFSHEQYLLIREEKCTLISGCSHKGILNILDFAKPYNIANVVGGFHLKDIEEDENLIEILADLSVDLIRNNLVYYTCHCTGLKQFSILKKYMNTSLNYLSGGQVIRI